MRPLRQRRREAPLRRCRPQPAVFTLPPSPSIYTRPPMSAYLQAAGPPLPAHWGPTAGGLQPLPASMLDVLVLQAQLLQLQAPYTGYAA